MIVFYSITHMEINSKQSTSQIKWELCTLDHDIYKYIQSFFFSSFLPLPKSFCWGCKKGLTLVYYSKSLTNAHHKSWKIFTSFITSKSFNLPTCLCFYFIFIVFEHVKKIILVFLRFYICKFRKIISEWKRKLHTLT